jgi:hypothetical protein
MSQEQQELLDKVYDLMRDYGESFRCVGTVELMIDHIGENIERTN